MAQEMEAREIRHRSPHLGAVAIAFTVLFCAGLYPIESEAAHFPRPWDSAQTIAAYFLLHSRESLLSALFEFGAAVPLGIFTAAIVSRMEFLGVRVAGVRIALFGGFAASMATTLCAIVMWVMALPGITNDVQLIRALYYLDFGLGGPGYSVPLALLLAGVSVPLMFYRFVPKWIAIMGLVVAVCGLLSWLSIEFLPATFLIPLTRFPGFVWMIAVGFALPKTARRAEARS